MKKYSSNSEGESHSGKGLQWDFEQMSAQCFNVREIKGKCITVDPEAPEHMLIEGENYLALQFLLQQYREKIGLIYIDPPYNTGFRKSEEGFFYHDQRSGAHHHYRHSAWLNFMYHRLTLAKELLREDAFIFISIDEHEFAHLKLLCDEIFGEENFAHYLVWKKRGTGGQVKDGALISQTEFVLMYAKNKKAGRLQKINDNGRAGEQWRDFRKSGGQWRSQFRPRQCFPFFYDEQLDKLSLQRSHKDEIEIWPENAKGESGFWENGYDTTVQRLANAELKVSRKTRSKKYKILQLEQKTAWHNAGNFLDIPSVNGAHEIKQFDLTFNNVKPIALIKYLLALAASDDDLILDFFAGSGSTAQAVMEWNAEQGKRQTCILCTNNESEICTTITYPRLQRVINGYIGESRKPYLGRKQNLKYFRVS